MAKGFVVTTDQNQGGYFTGWIDEGASTRLTWCNTSYYARRFDTFDEAMLEAKLIKLVAPENKYAVRGEAHV